MDFSAQTLMEQAASMFNECDWKLLKDESETNVAILESKQFKNYVLPHYRIRATINLPIADLVNLVWDTTMISAKVDDPSIVEFKVIEETEDYKIRRQVNQPNLPFVWPRETVFIQHKHIEDNGDVWLIGYSVDHADCPINDKEVVRTKMAMSVYRYIAITDTRTLVQRVANIDPRGSIPLVAIKATATRAVNAFNNWAARVQE